MGKHVKQADPLRPRASRVEKSCRPGTSTRTSLHHVALSILGPVGDVDSDKSHEGLSELEEDDCQERSTVNQPGDGDEGSECDAEDPDLDGDDIEESGCEASDGDEGSECDVEDPDLDGNDSEESGSDASDDGSQSDLKYELEQRKRDLLKERERNDKAREFAMTKEEEVDAAYKSLCKAEEEFKTIPIGSLAGQEFQLFCSDYVEHMSRMSLCFTSTVLFYYANRLGKPCAKPKKSNGGTNKLYGRVGFEGGPEFEIAPFCSPKHGSREAIIAELWMEGGRLSITFIDDRYLKLRVSPRMVGLDPNRYDVPEVFEFVGILVGLEEEQEAAQSRRSPSPRESWFEMNHPMGWWAQSRLERNLERLERGWRGR